MDGNGAYHLVGIGGVGMSALAQVLRLEGNRVSGSDRDWDRGLNRDVFDTLTGMGIELVRQDGSGVAADLDAVVVSTAIEPDNPDLAEAGRRGVAVRHRAEVLAERADRRRCVAVTGTCGKSTVTAMIGRILEHAGLDPVVVNGAACLDWRGEGRIGNVRWGASDWWVVEVDESDRSLLRFHPEWAVITNASQDHFDAEETLRLFEAFARQVRRGIVSGIGEPEWRRGFAPRLDGTAGEFTYGGTAFRAPMPGRHNAENALIAVAMCERLGIAAETIREGLGAFRGVHRRLERVGTARGVTVLDDYAHNPAKIRAAWEAVSTQSPRVLGIWRPHGYGPLRSMRDALAAAFREVCRPGDRLWLLPVYDAGGTADRSIGSAALAEAIGRPDAVRVAEVDEAARAVAAEAREGDMVLVMGARDPGLPAFARGLLAALTPPG
jgi:UDP-N-acetylmuramate--alanine ligase